MIGTEQKSLMPFYLTSAFRSLRTTELRCVLVGLGNIGVGYDIVTSADTAKPFLHPATIRTHAVAIARSPGMRLIAGVDPDRQARKQFTDAFDLPAFQDIEHAPPDADLVVLSVPTYLHLEAAEAALSHFRPTILVVEKPAGLSTTQTRKIHALAVKFGARLYVNYIRQHLPETHEVARLIQLPQTGALVGGQFQYNLGLRNNGSHFIRLLLDWLHDKDLQVLHKSLPASEQALNPNFLLRINDADLEFHGHSNSIGRVADLRLIFEGAELQYTHGGRAIRWVELPGNGGSIKETVLDANLDRYQLFLYRAITFPNGQSDPGGDIKKAIAVQTIIDEALDGS